MSDGAQDLSRRDMMRLGATGVAAASLADLPAMADEKAAPDKLPKRRYGRTGLEIGWLVGASDWPKELIPRAVNAGVNYWHKAQRWTADDAPAGPQGPAEGVVLSRMRRGPRERGPHARPDRRGAALPVRQGTPEGIGRRILRRLQVPLRLSLRGRGEAEPGHGPGVRAAQEGGAGQAPGHLPASLQQHRRGHGLGDPGLPGGASSPTTRPSSSTPTATARRSRSGSTWRRRRTSRPSP